MTNYSALNLRQLRQYETPNMKCIGIHPPVDSDENAEVKHFLNYIEKPLMHMLKNVRFW